MPCYGIALPLGQRFAEGIARGALAAQESMPGVRVRVLRDPPTTASVAAWAAWAAPDGVIAFATEIPGVRVVVGVCVPGRTGVSVDETAIGCLAADHLCALRPATLVVVDIGATWSMARVEASATRCDQLGQASVRLSAPAWDQAGGLTELVHFLGQCARPIGCFVPNDRSAVAVANALSEAGLTIGREVLLIGVDDDDLACRSVIPALSSVQVPWEQVGAEALRLLHAGGQQRIVVSPLGVVVRGSSDPLATDDATVRLAIAAAHAGAEGVEVLALAAGMQRRSFERHCQAVIGLSPLQILHRVRLDRARKMLLAGSTIDDTARVTGWATRAAFTQAFRHACGETPGSWRTRRLTPPNPTPPPA